MHYQHPYHRKLYHSFVTQDFGVMEYEMSCSLAGVPSVGFLDVRHPCWFGLPPQAWASRGNERCRRCFPHYSHVQPGQVVLPTCRFLGVLDVGMFYVLGFGGVTARQRCLVMVVTWFGYPESRLLAFHGWSLGQVGLAMLYPLFGSNILVSLCSGDHTHAFVGSCQVLYSFLYSLFLLSTERSARCMCSQKNKFMMAR